MPDVPETRGQAAALLIATTGPGLFNGLVPARLFEKGSREDLLFAERIASAAVLSIGFTAGAITKSALPMVAAIATVVILVGLNERATADRWKGGCDGC